MSLFVYGTHKDKIITYMLLRSATARRVYMCTTTRGSKTNKKNELGINQKSNTHEQRQQQNKSKSWPLPVRGPLARRDHVHVDGSGPRVRGGVLRGHSHKTHRLGHVAVFHEPEMKEEEVCTQPIIRESRGFVQHWMAY